jgi:hypothetical protein
MKIADSFAYLQMAHFLQQISSEGLGSGWFGFLYSLPMALINILIQDDFLSGKIVNLILWNISAYLLWCIAQPLLSRNFSLILILLYFCSASLLSFHIHILSENIYIPLFLWFFLILQKFLSEWEMISSPSLLLKRRSGQAILLGIILGLLYLTRAEAFIYMLSIGILSFGLLWQKKLSFKHFFLLGSIFFLSFFLFISPYLVHLHSITGEWWLTNKGASNLRQAELRGTDHMDDAGFEQAVAELTADKQHLIAGFAGGMRYDTPQIQGSLTESFLQNPEKIISRIWENQKKLFTKNIPEIFLGDSFKLYFGDDTRFARNIFFLIFLLLPFSVLMYGFWKLFQKEKIYFSLIFALFFPALLFFTLFFTLNRYFIIFLPLLLLVFTYGLSQIFQISKIAWVLFFGNMLCVSLLSCLVYWNIESPKDAQYLLKQEAWIWLWQYLSWIQKADTDEVNNFSESWETIWVPIEDWSSFSSDEKKLFSKQKESFDIMERFPIVTYYSGVKTRWITPYTDNPDDILTYARYNDIEMLVVDSMDFLTYRPKLAALLQKTPEGFSKFKEFQNEKWQKVILYLIKK